MQLFSHFFILLKHFGSLGVWRGCEDLLWFSWSGLGIHWWRNGGGSERLGLWFLMQGGLLLRGFGFDSPSVFWFYFHFLEKIFALSLLFRWLSNRCLLIRFLRCWNILWLLDIHPFEIIRHLLLFFLQWLLLLLGLLVGFSLFWFLLSNRNHPISHISSFTGNLALDGFLIFLNGSFDALFDIQIITIWSWSICIHLLLLWWLMWNYSIILFCDFVLKSWFDIKSCRSWSRCGLCGVCFWRFSHFWDYRRHNLWSLAVGINHNSRQISINGHLILIIIINNLPSTSTRNHSFRM